MQKPPMEKGMVVENLESGKRYAVVTNRDGWIGYIGVRGGKNYGPIRSAIASSFARNFGRVYGFRAVFTGVSWNFWIEQEGIC